MKIKGSGVKIEKTGALLALAYPDRIARKRDSSLTSFLTASGKGAYFTGADTVSMHEYIVAASLDGNLQNSKIFLAAPYSRAALDREFSGQFKTVQTIAWDKRAGAVTAGKDIVFGSLVLEHHKISDIDPNRACDLLMDEIQRSEFALLPWNRTLSSLKERAAFLHRTGRFPALPDLSDTALKSGMEVWLRPFLTGIFSLKQLSKMNLESAFLSLLTWKQRQVIDKEAPTHVRVPSGSKKPLRYSSEQGLLDSPVLEVRLQEMFGLTRTPKIAGQTIPVTLHLLSPAGRPVQITQDLENFWKTTYAEVKKDLMGRYPKHFWPDDPLNAVPTNRAKPRPNPRSGPTA
jgi:ATP-dependent helicase HrpB